MTHAKPIRKNAGAAKSLREEMLAARPEIAEREKKHARKIAIAMRLRALRDARNMTQADVAAASGLSQPAVARLEALTGPVPTFETIEKYVLGCGGHIALLISPEAIDLPDEAVA